MSGFVQTAKDAGNYVAETAKEAVSGASKEGNKQVAKDNNASLGTRAQAAGNAVSDKVKESGHGTKADVHKESAKH